MEREELQPGVGVDVASADLHESSTDGQHFQPGPLCGAGQGVEHDVDAVPVGVDRRICSAKSVLRES